MPTNEEEIRTLIERWAGAVHRGDLATVLADHDEDIVMFDVPPPYEGVRGLDGYRQTWPPFFRWQAQGASFEIEELDVTAGDEVAFAYALLRCGTPADLAAAPDNRLRLTLGLRRRAGRWVVSHEHHSFPSVDSTAGPAGPRAAAERELRRLHQRWFDGTAAKDLDALMAAIADDVVSYEHEQPLRYVGVQAVREVCAAGLDAAGDGAVRWDVPDLAILVDGDLAVAWGLNRVELRPAAGPAVDSWSRGTRVFARRDGAWLMVHQHLSYPYDPASGVARTDLAP
ncbi:nuclear transport factor 2 family protein [Micromonospora sp. C28SCA-DRY-2]|uniref:nuclear transport factor 2 family protein n=1 Tax=Micromonospora sp. C28SCA-DRY-2 TaxID=3059522 RepID=UPI0026752498|nr:nuclear transport factor 2 family protein [Micromonospora sp. C28SCA-DRY-2]MDO3703074.1 nuclear transport factor 2 family protein [Micromonospora sp. C28SCA-DRY-2]